MLFISERETVAIKAHVQQSLPLECCGLIIGSHDQASDIYHVHSLMPCENVSPLDQTKNFEIDPKARFNLLRTERSGKLGTDKLIGFYHSHPKGPDHPSTTDQSMVYEPELIWLIATPNTLKAFYFEVSENKFEEIPLQIQKG